MVVENLVKMIFLYVKVTDQCYAPSSSSVSFHSSVDWCNIGMSTVQKASLFGFVNDRVFTKKKKSGERTSTHLHLL